MPYKARIDPNIRFRIRDPESARFPGSGFCDAGIGLRPLARLTVPFNWRDVHEKAWSVSAFSERAPLFYGGSPGTEVVRDFSTFLAERRPGLTTRRVPSRADLGRETSRLDSSPRLPRRDHRGHADHRRIHECAPPDSSFSRQPKTRVPILEIIES